jgi:DNA-binding MarR family transcriptional regulator
MSIGKDYRLLSLVSIKHLNRDWLKSLNINESQLLVLVVLQYGTHYFLDPEKTSNTALRKVLNVTKEYLVNDLKHLSNNNLIRRSKFKYNYYSLTQKGIILLRTYKNKLNSLDLFVDNSLM